jgi:sterol desaturase/sphingolipid hydroxylase (fatty acid hydroxylase superfamily)
VTKIAFNYTGLRSGNTTYGRPSIFKRRYRDNFYKKQQYYRQQDFNYILFIIFYSLILGLAVYLFIFNNTINVYLKVFITFLLAIYPFIIERIEFFVYFIFYYVYALINGVPIDLGNYYGFTFTNK